MCKTPSFKSTCAVFKILSSPFQHSGSPLDPGFGDERLEGKGVHASRVLGRLNADPDRDVLAVQVVKGQHLGLLGLAVHPLHLAQVVAQDRVGLQAEAAAGVEPRDVLEEALAHQSVQRVPLHLGADAHRRHQTLAQRLVVRLGGAALVLTACDHSYSYFCAVRVAKGRVEF